MSHSKVTRNNPALIVVCVDLSGSMAEKIQYNGELLPKSTVVDNLINSFVDELLFRCRKGGDFMNYFNISVIGYNNGSAYSIFDNRLSNKYIFSVTDLINMNVEKISLSKQRIGADGRYYTHISQINRWVCSSPSGDTPTYLALSQVYNLVRDWIEKNPNNPNTPIVTHITDGDATDREPSDLIDISKKIKSLSIGENNPLLMNINIASFESKSIIFPSSIDQIPKDNEYARTLYEMSSILPEEFHNAINSVRSKGDALPIDKTVRAVAYNASFNELVGMMSIGTSTICR